MKRTAAIFFLMVFVSQLALKLYVFSYYQINKSYISANLCENRKAPEKGCNGKCYLKKELAKVDENHQDKSSAPKSVKIEEISEVFCSHSEIEIPLCISIDADFAKHSFYSWPHIKDVTADFFHPPQLG